MMTTRTSRTDAIIGSVLTLSIATGIATTPPAAATPPISQRPSDHPSSATLLQPDCRGIHIERCVWMRWDELGGHVRAWADIRDIIGDAGNYDVKVTDIRLLFNGEVVDTAPDGDGWQRTYDYGAGEAKACRDGAWSVSAEFLWQNAETGDRAAQTIEGAPALVNCR